MFEKLEPKRKSFHKEDHRIKETLEKQEDLGIVGDISSEDYTDVLNKEVNNRKIIGNEGKVVAEDSWEEIQRDEELSDKIEALRLDYERLKGEIKERESILQELRQSRRGAEQSVKNIDWNEIVSKERYSVATDMIRTAEERIERLRKNIERKEIEIVPLYEELGKIEEIINSLSKLIKAEVVDENGEIASEGYKFNLN